MNCVNVIKGKRLDFMDEIINAMDGVIGAKSLITLTRSLNTLLNRDVGYVTLVLGRASAWHQPTHQPTMKCRLGRKAQR